MTTAAEVLAGTLDTLRAEIEELLTREIELNDELARLIARRQQLRDAAVDVARHHDLLAGVRVIESVQLESVSIVATPEWSAGLSIRLVPPAGDTSDDEVPNLKAQMAAQAHDALPVWPEPGPEREPEPRPGSDEARPLVEPARDWSYKIRDAVPPAEVDERESYWREVFAWVVEQKTAGTYSRDAMRAVWGANAAHNWSRSCAKYGLTIEATGPAPRVGVDDAVRMIEAAR